MIEDSPAGIRAGLSAGCQVVGLATTHSVAQVRAAGATWIVRDLRDIKFMRRDGPTKEIWLEISNVLER